MTSSPLTTATAVQRPPADTELQWKAAPTDAGSVEDAKRIGRELWGPLPEGAVDRIVNVTGVEDLVGDVTVPGCYGRTIATRVPKVARDHDRSRRVGKTLAAAELLPGDPRLPKRRRNGQPWPREAGAYVIRAQFMLETQAGKDAFAEELFYGPEAEWSIGYTIPPGAHQPDGKGRRLILDIDVWENSQVMWGASEDTGAWGGWDTRFQAMTVAGVKDAFGHGVDREVRALHAAALAGVIPLPDQWEEGKAAATCRFCSRQATVTATRGEAKPVLACDRHKALARAALRRDKTGGTAAVSLGKYPEPDSDGKAAPAVQESGSYPYEGIDPYRLHTPAGPGPESDFYAGCEVCGEGFSDDTAAHAKPRNSTTPLPRSEGKAAAPGEHKTGVMVALYPTLDVAEKIAVEGGVPPEELHVTLAYLGKLTEGDVLQTSGRTYTLAQAQAALETATADALPVDGKLHGLIQWEGDDGVCYSAALDAPGLDTLRPAIRSALLASGAPLPSKHGFTPHLALAYGEPVDPLDDVSVVFDHVSLVWGDRRLDLALDGPDSALLPDEQRNVPPPEPAANTPGERQVGSVYPSEEPTGGTKEAITVVSRDTLPEDGWESFRLDRLVRMRRMDGRFTVETRYGPLTVEDGWLTVDAEGWPLPVDAAVVDRDYRPADENAPRDLARENVRGLPGGH